MTELKKNQKNRYEEATQIAKIGIDHMSISLPLLEAVREEERHALELINGVVDKALDLAKLLITISFPALITLFTVKRESFYHEEYIASAFMMLILGIVLFAAGMKYKLDRLPGYLKGSTSRLESYAQWLQLTLHHAKNEDKKLDHKKRKNTS